MSSTSWTNLLDLIYPVGSIYQSVSSSSPASLFGGTWVEYHDNSVISARNTNTSYTIDNNMTVNFAKGDYELRCFQLVFDGSISNVLLYSSDVQNAAGWDTSSGTLKGWIGTLNADSAARPSAFSGPSYSTSTHAFYEENIKAYPNRIAFFSAKPLTRNSSTSTSPDLLYIKPAHIWKRTA